MYILGINCHTHISSASLIQDGKLIAAIEEERLTRIKNDGSFPVNSINFCCQATGIKPEEIDEVVFFLAPLHGILKRVYILLSHLPQSLSFFFKHRTERVTVGIFFQNLFIKMKLRKMGIRAKVHFAEHHFCHMASYLISGIDKAAILSVDLGGEIATTVFGKGENGKITKIKELYYPHSLGIFYSALTQYLGYRQNIDEYKVMGLAAYGKPVYYDKFKKILKLLPDGEFNLDLDYFAHHLGKDVWYTDKFVSLFGPGCHDEAELENARFRDVAASAQKIFEEALEHMVSWLKEKTQLDTLILTGGCSLNSTAAGKILAKGIFKNVYIPPASYDAGTSLGAAYHYWNKGLKRTTDFVLETAALGPSFSNEECKEALDRSGLKYKYEQDIETETAKLIEKGNICGWFQGRSEFGPRALGNRSILADPRNPAIRDLINSKVKFREAYRPFAPSVLEEKASLYFSGIKRSPFMGFVYNVMPGKKELIPGVIHVDGTSRVQTVTRPQNERFWKLISSFETLTGIPLVLNTSFNVRGEPIVCTPKDAIECFLNTDMNYLVLENYLCWK